MKISAFPYTPGIILFIIFLFIGLYTYKDYGVSWDEDAQRNIGILNYDYIFNNGKELKNTPLKYYGAGFEIPLIWLEKTMGLQDSRDIYLMRHLVTHIFFLVSALCAYVLFYRLTGSRIVAATGFLFLVMHPRIYAHSFFNTKDIPVLCMFIISFLFIEIAFRKNKIIWFIPAGLCCGYLTGIRIAGILLSVGVCLFIILDIFFNRKEKKKLSVSLLQFSVFIVCFAGMLLVSYPNLWTKPIENFVEAWQNFAHFKWMGSVLFMGHLIPSSAIPWYYLPVWFFITTPPLYFFTGIAGTILFACLFIRRPKKYLQNSVDRNFLLYAICFIVPAAMVIFEGSVLYDDWRHLYFIYPCFILLGLFALKEIQSKRIKRIVFIVITIQVVFTGSFMVRAHPFQEVYFNALVSHKPEYLRNNYELAYWGSCYKQGIEYIVTHDTSAHLKISGRKIPTENNISIMPTTVRNRLTYEMDADSADYFITNYRAHPGDYPFSKVYDIQVLNSTILSVYKISKKVR